MAIKYGIPTYTAAVTVSGLYVHYDAGNPTSYPGSGATWTDLTGGGSHATLSGSYAYSSSGGGSIDFNSSTGCAQFTIAQSALYNAEVVTVEMWTKINTLANAMPFGWGLYDVYSAGGSGAENLGFNTNNGDCYGITNAKVVSNGLLGNWKHYTFVMYNGANNHFTWNNKMYINSDQQTLVNLINDRNGPITTNMTFGATIGNIVYGGAGQICGWRSDSSYRAAQTVGVFRVYNRELTQKEIFLNFEAQRARFGV